MFLSYVHRGQRVKCLGFATPEGLRPLTLDECESFPWLRDGRDEWLRGLDAPIEFVESDGEKRLREFQKGSDQ